MWKKNDIFCFINQCTSSVEERRVEKPNYVADSNAYWIDVLRNQEKKEEIDFIVEWFKNIKYCEAFSVYSNGEIDVWPDNKKNKKGNSTRRGFY